MDFEEMFDSWSLEEKVEWILGPNIFNLTHHARSIIVDLNKELKRFKNLCESYRIDCDKTAIREANAYKIIGLDNKELNRTKRALWLARAERAKLLVQLDMEGHYDYIVSQESQGKTPKAELDRWYAGWDYAEHVCRTYAEKFREVK